jgi:serine/threonine protein phosphatase PrpC
VSTPLALDDLIAEALRTLAEREVQTVRTLGLAAKTVRVQALTAAGAATGPNEDAFALLAAGDTLLVGVFDGTTSLAPIPALAAAGLTGARFAAQVLRAALLRDGRAAAGCDVKDLLGRLNARLGEATRQLAARQCVPLDDPPASSATLARLDFGAGRLQVASVSDSWCLVVDRDGGSALVTTDRNAAFDAQVFALIGRIAAEAGLTPRAARARPEVQALTRALRLRKHNAPDGSGVGVVNGDPALLPYIETIDRPLAGVRGVLLGTDGLVPPGRTLTDPADRAWLLGELGAGGLPRLLDLKRTAEDADPAWQHIRFKHSDDAAAVYVEW